VNISQYLIYIPYRTVWSFLHLFRRKKQIHFYCGGHVDYVVMQSIKKHFPEAQIVSKNKKTKNELEIYGIKSISYPTFPDILVMPRHTARKYPEPRIKKVGMRHGAYNFKGNVDKSRFHLFDIYFVSSSTEHKQAEKDGIKNTYPIGYPKLDAAFDGTFNKELLASYRQNLDLDANKAVIIFTSTWNKSGMSAIDYWVNRVSELTSNYNILVTVHQWTEKKYREILRETPDIHFIADKNILPYLMISDIMIGDISSIIGDFCALNKPIITFKVPYKKKIREQIRKMINEISFRIESFDELKETIQYALKNPDHHEKNRLKYNKIMFDNLDGKAGERAAEKIKEIFLNEQS